MIYIIQLICIITILFAIDINTGEQYSNIYLLPLVFLVFSSIHYLLKTFHKTIVYKLFLIQGLIRYCIIPIGISNGDYLGYGAYSMNANLAIIFMIIELIFIYLTILFLDNKYKNKFKSVEKLILVNKNYWLFGFIALMLLIILGTGYFRKINFIWQLQDYIQNIDENGDEESSSLGGLLFRPFKIGLLLIFSSFIIGKNNWSRNKKILWLIFVIGLSCTFIVGSSRLSILTFILPFYFILRDILSKKHIKIINIGLLSLIVPVIIITSLAKFTRGNNVATTDSIFNTASLNAYFAGPGNVAVGIDAFEERVDKNYVQIMLNDIFQNIPLASKLTDNQYKTNYIFNYKVYGHSLWQTQIVPLNIAGLFHFNVLGIGFYSSIFIILASYFERKAIREIYLPYKYVFYSLVLTVSMIFMLNIGSMMATIFRTLMFIYLPFYISNQLQKIK